MRNATRKILVVDEEVHILHVISLKLRRAGYKVFTAQDGEAGLELAQIELPDLVIAGYEISCLSGIELCQRLRQIPSTRQIPAIILTADGFELDYDVMKARGIRCCLNKPFRAQEMLQIVDEILEGVAV